MANNGDKEPGLSDLKLSVTCGGNRYEMMFGEFSAHEEVQYKRLTGYDLMAPFLNESINSIMLAGLVWLYRKRTEKKLQFNSVLKEFKFSDMDNLVVTDGTESDEDEDDEETLEELGAEVFASPED